MYMCISFFCRLLSVHMCILFFCVFFDFSFVAFPSVLWHCWLGLLTCKNRLPYNLYCVGGEVKHYNNPQSASASVLNSEGCVHWMHLVLKYSGGGSSHGAYTNNTSETHWRIIGLHGEGCVVGNIRYGEYRCLQCESKKSPYGFLKFFPKRLGIFNQFFTHLLLYHFYTRLQIFI